MPDRRAIIIGSWLAKGRNRPTPQRIRGLTDRWTRIFDSNRYGYRSVNDPTTAPVPFLNPRHSQILELLENARQIGPETELLLYFVGHSVSLGEHDLNLILGTGEEGADRMVALSTILSEIRQTGISRMICILDTCHAGRSRTTFSALRDQAFAMFASGTAYAFEANFSDGLLQAFEQPIRKNDQRIDRRSGGVTYQKLFQEARRRLRQTASASGIIQEPVCFGDLGGTVIEPAPRVIGDEYSEFALSRTIYGRLFILLDILKMRDRTMDELVNAARDNPAFVLKNGEAGQGVFVSLERMTQYVDFLRAARWLVNPRGRLAITDQGRADCDRTCFNRALLEAIEKHVLPDGLNLAFLDACIQSLLDDMIPPTPVRLKDRAAMLGPHTLPLTPEIRVALSVLPTTGRYLKGSADAIFPADPS